MIRFRFEGHEYQIPQESELIILPDGRILQANAWTTGNHPEPTHLEVVSSVTKARKSGIIGWLQFEWLYG